MTMNDARDELAAPPYLVGVTDDFPGGNDDDLVGWAFEAGIGYERFHSRPRTITTAEELDALPPGTVVLSSSYRHNANGQQVSFQRWPNRDWYRGARSGDTHPDNFLPATIIYEPEA